MDAVDTTILSALIMGVLDATIGVIYDMQLVEIFLYGIAMVQGWFYFSTYLHKDHVSIKIMVAINLALDTAQVLMLADMGYRYLVTDAVTILLLFEEGKLFLYRLVIVQQGLGTAIAMIIQHFYCWRIYKLCRFNKTSYLITLGVTAVLSLLSNSANATAIAFLVLLADRKENLNNLLDPRIGNLFSMANILTVVTDVLISIVMIVLLQKSKTGFRRSTDVINRLMIFTLSTGLPTMLTALACEILIKTSPETPFFLIFIVTLGRWYTNCLLVNLNARDYINGMADMPSMGLELIPLATLTCLPSEERRRPYNETFQINIETRTDIAYDHPDPCIQTPAIVFDPEGKSVTDMHGKSVNMSF